MVRKTLFVALLTVALSLPSMGQSIDESVFKGTFMASYDAATGKIIQLAEAMSEEQYDWRPSEGVRSVKESLMHVANANAFFAGAMGAEVPASLKGRNLEKEIESKEDALKVLKESIKLARDAVGALSSDDMTKEVDWFDGSKKPMLAMVFVVSDHANEHLGQLIAYARSNEVAPPWSN